MQKRIRKPPIKERKNYVVAARKGRELTKGTTTRQITMIINEKRGWRATEKGGKAKTDQ